MLAHVGRDGAIDLLDFGGCVGFAAAFDEDVALCGMLALSSGNVGSVSQVTYLESILS